MKENYIPKEQRKKILLLCDDITSFSGVASVAREMVIGSAHYFNWVNIGGSIQHPNKGKKIDLSGDTNKFAGIEDASVIIYPTDGYGNPEMIRVIIEIEKPDAVMIFTDPRYWIWLFQIEREIRKQIPLIYLNIWDDLPAPLYNKSYYNSCDALLAISKQTKNINEIVLGDEAKNKVIKYIPHGINDKFFFPITPEYSKYNEYLKFKEELFENKEYNFVLFWNSRNFQRKQPADLILSWRYFLDQLPPDDAKKCLLVMHTSPLDQNGTDLYSVKELLIDDKDHNIIFSQNPLSVEQMNYLYNISDATISISSNEGWGLSLTESLMTGKMIIANVTGGMQDQMRFEDKKGKWIDFTPKFPSNHFGTIKKHGKWAIPIFPTSHTLIGSLPTPYIFDDRAEFTDISDAIMKLYNMSKEERIENGKAGLEWVKSDEAKMTAEAMCNGIIKGINETFKKFKPRKSFDLIKVEELEKNYIKHPIKY
jgi:hypothetical protein